MRRQKLKGNAKALRDLGYLLYEVAQGQREEPSPATLAYIGIAAALATDDDGRPRYNVGFAQQTLNLTAEQLAHVHDELEETLGLRFIAEPEEPKERHLSLVKTA